MEMRTSTLFACAAGNENQPKGHFSSEKKKTCFNAEAHRSRARATRILLTINKASVDEHPDKKKTSPVTDLRCVRTETSMFIPIITESRYAQRGRAEK